MSKSHDQRQNSPRQAAIQARNARIRNMFRQTPGNLPPFEPAVTPELLDWLRKKIAGRKAIVVRTRSPHLAQSLRIPAIDAYPVTPQHLDCAGSYPIEIMGSLEAFRKYRPAVVIAWGALPVIAAYNEDGSVRSTGACDLEIALHCEDFVYIGASAPQAQMRHRLMYHRPSAIVVEKEWLHGAVHGEPAFIAAWNQNTLLQRTEKREDWVPFLAYATEYFFAKHKAAGRAPRSLPATVGYYDVRKILYAAADVSDNGRQALTWLLYAKVAAFAGKVPIDLVWESRTEDLLAYLGNQPALFHTDGEPQADIAISLLREFQPEPLSGNNHAPTPNP